MAGTLKDKILAADDIAFEDHDVPEWDVTVRVRGMTGTQRDAFEAKMVAARQAGHDAETRLADFRARVLVKCLHDPATGDLVFGDGDAAALGAKSGAVVDRLFAVAQRLSGMDQEALEAARGNSGTVPSGGSTSG
jgi:hypothetical protein